MPMIIDPTTDARLVADTLSGDREAFGQLYDRYARIMRAVVLGVSGDWAGVDDMVQESFLRAFRKLATLREPERFGAWIAGISRQVARERRRSQRRDRHEFREPQTLNVESQNDTTAEVQTRDELALVIERLGELDERERLAVCAYFLEGRGAPEIAELLGLSRSGFYALVQRGIARLALAVQPCGGKVGDQ
jgi:RNA polymerase sigma-70 factor (ECF subfamily)